MIVNRIARCVFSTAKKQMIPKPPKLLSGELQAYRFDAEDAQIYDGYSLQELYGAKIGPKHPPAVKAEMKKDTIASVLLFVFGMGTIFHLDNMFRKELEDIQKVEKSKFTRKVTFSDV